MMKEVERRNSAEESEGKRRTEEGGGGEGRVGEGEGREANERNYYKDTMKFLNVNTYTYILHNSACIWGVFQLTIHLIGTVMNILYQNVS
jgi:hypothetical protein